MGDSMILITLKQALEALESRDGTLFDDELAAITALRQAIEQAEKQTVSTEYDQAVEITQAYERAWKAATAEQPETIMAEYKFQTYAAYKSDGEMKIGVVPEQAKPVAWLHPANATCVTTDPTAYARGIPLYTAPPQRKPLTVDQIIAIIHPIVMADMPDEMTDYEIARAIEAAHGIKEKNT
jgi:hypothetical protein